MLSADFGYVLPGTYSFSSQQGEGVVTDTAGNSYLVASNRSVAKYDPSGNLVWFRTFTETVSTTDKNNIAIDDSGDIYISGSFSGTGTFGSYTLFSGNSGNNVVWQTFTAKLDRNGNFLWARDWISGANNHSTGVAVDSQGNVYTGGVFSGAIYPDPSLSTLLSTAGGTDALITKYDANGNYLWSKQIGGTGYDDLQGIAVDGADNVYATGQFSGLVDFDPNGGVYNLDGGFFNSAYVMKLDTAGNFVWARATATARAAPARDAEWPSMPRGTYTPPASSPARRISIPRRRAFTTSVRRRCSGTTATFRSWMRRAPFSGSASSTLKAHCPWIRRALPLTPTATFTRPAASRASVDFNAGSSPRYLTNAGFSDVYLAQYDSQGNYVWATSFGSSGPDGGYGVAVNPVTNDVFLAGYFSGTVDFDPGVGTQFRTVYAGGRNSFLLKLTQSSVSGQVWNDRNGDGLHNIAEPGLGGVVALLYSTDDVLVGNADDALVASTVTDSQGRYKFVGVASGTNYYVKFRSPVGFSAFSPQFVGANAGLWSSATAAGVTSVIPMIPQTRDTENVGLVGAAPGFGFALAATTVANTQGKAVATDSLGNVYYGGILNGTADFDQGAGVNNVTGSNAAFIAKYTAAGALLWAEAIPVNNSQALTALKVDSNGNVYAMGMFTSAVDFNPGTGLYTVTADDVQNPYVLKLDGQGKFVWARELVAGAPQPAPGWRSTRRTTFTRPAASPIRRISTREALRRRR